MSAAAAVFVRGFAHVVPERVVTNEEIAPLLGVEPGWIEQVSGIRERRWAADGETVTSLATRAAQQCLAESGVVATDLGMILVASGSAERFCPGPASSVAAALGLSACPALDVPVASAGSLIGLDLARRLAPTLGPVLVVGAEIMSCRIDLVPEGKNTGILFGDGAGACLVAPDGPGLELLDGSLSTDGNASEILAIAGDRLHMDGGAVILQASRKLPRAITLLLEKHGIAAGDVSQVLMHQANLNLIQRVAKAVGVSPERFFTNIQRYGNTSSASMLIAASEWFAGTEPSPGPVLFAAFGTGLNWGAVLARFAS